MSFLSKAFDMFEAIGVYIFRLIRYPLESALRDGYAGKQQTMPSETWNTLNESQKQQIISFEYRREAAFNGFLTCVLVFGIIIQLIF